MLPSSFLSLSCHAQVLQRLKQADLTPAVPLHVCYNPYLPDDKDAEEERRRLTAKLATGLVAGVWLQMGSDLGRLQKGLEFLQQQLSQASPSPPSIYGSVFLPTKKYIPKSSSWACILLYRWHQV